MRCKYLCLALMIFSLDLTGASPAAAQTTAPCEAAKDKIACEGLQAKNREITAKNASIEATNAVLTRAFAGGVEAYQLGNVAMGKKDYPEAKRQYTIAIAKYSEGLSADPDQPALLVNKAAALKARGVIDYNSSLSLTDSEAKTVAVSAARSDFRDAAGSATKAVSLIGAQTPPTDTAAQTAYNNNRYAALSTRADTLRLLVTKADASKVDDGIAAYHDYIAAELDPSKKLNAQLALANMAFDVEAFDKALVEYRKFLIVQPDNLDALVRGGMALFYLGLANNDKTKLQEAANLMKRFMENAPDTHPFKQDVVVVLDSLFKEQNIKPQ